MHFCWSQHAPAATDCGPDCLALQPATLRLARYHLDARSRSVCAQNGTVPNFLRTNLAVLSPAAVTEKPGDDARERSPS